LSQAQHQALTEYLDQLSAAHGAAAASTMQPEVVNSSSYTTLQDSVTQLEIIPRVDIALQFVKEKYTKAEHRAVAAVQAYAGDPLALLSLHDSRWFAMNVRVLTTYFTEKNKADAIHTSTNYYRMPPVQCAVLDVDALDLAMGMDVWWCAFLAFVLSTVEDALSHVVVTEEETSRAVSVLEESRNRVVETMKGARGAYPFQAAMWNEVPKKDRHRAVASSCPGLPLLLPVKAPIVEGNTKCPRREVMEISDEVMGEWDSTVTKGSSVPGIELSIDVEGRQKYT